MPIVSFDKWLPDRPAIRAPHLRDAKNCLPTLEAYGPLRTPNPTTDALSLRCQGAFSARDVDGNAMMFAGDQSKLYKLIGGSWTDFSRVAGYTSLSNRWRAVAYGDRLIVVNGVDEPQYLDMSGVASAFANLAGSPPAAQFVATYAEFVFLASTAAGNNILKWSGFSNSEQWSAGSNQSDEQEFVDGGRITGLVATKAVLYVFQEKCIRRVLYVGGDVIMQIDKIVDGIGCVEPNSLVFYGQRTMFLDESGFFQWDGASEPQPIGVEAVDQWFLADCQRVSWSTMSAAIDPRSKICAWGYASTGAAAGLPDSMLFYNYAVDKWSYARIDHEVLVSALSLSTSLDDLDATFPDLDVMAVSLDDSAFQGGAFYLSVFTSLHRLASFTGSTMEATFESGEFPLFDGRRARVAWLKPIVTGDTAGAATAAGGSAVRSGDAIVFQSAVAQQASGRCPQRGVNGFFCAAKIVLPAAAAWTAAIGLDFAATQAGVK